MNPLEPMFQEIRHGKNIDLYVTVIAAAIVALLEVFGVGSTDIVNAATLAVLALLAAAFLGTRRRLEEIQTRLKNSAGVLIVREYPLELSQDLARASEIWLVGVHLIRILRENNAILKTRLQQGARIHLLVVNPDSPAIRMVAARNPGRPAEDRERENIRSNLADLCELKQLAADRVEIRTVDDPLMYGACMLDPEKPNGIVYLQRYTYQAGITPKLSYRAGDGEWFDLVRNEVQALWSRATEWNCDAPAFTSTIQSRP
ncbi:MAG TPA: hypothetical protein VND68_02980 [Chloroflexia bacterium]|jgi:hypothetical protein|nr:hypothetical protein [Chloroflexia bacterium]